MMTEDTIAMVLAGGVPTREQFSVLTMNRSKAALPFGGVYRLIDFSLSCLMDSDIERVGIITQFLPSSLIDHVADGYSWDMKGYQRCAKILPPYISYEDNHRWYRGTGNAILQNINFIKDRQPKHVFIVPGEHIYDVDFKKMLRQHEKSDSQITLAYKEMPEQRYCPRFGYVKKQDSTITDFIEKPDEPKSRYVSLGIYLFDTEVLLEEIEKRGEDRDFFDLVSHIIVPLANEKRIEGYEHKGKWCYLYDYLDYFLYHRDLLNGDLPLREWNIMTNLEDRDTGFRPPAQLYSSGNINHSLVAPGCIIEGEVESSVLFPGVHVKRNSKVTHSIIMHDAVIKENCEVSGLICDKDVVIEPHCKVVAMQKNLISRDSLILLGKSSHIQSKQKIKPGTHIKPGTIL